MPKLAIVVASTRPGRVGLPVAKWFYALAQRHGAFELDFVDLAEVNLPMMDEPNHPRLGKYTHQHTRDWSRRIDGADAFVLVMPEYNFGFNAPLKNAIDYLQAEWKHKPVGFVSYGGVAGGTRAVQMIKQVLTTLGMVPLFEAVYVPFVAQYMKDGTFQATEVFEQSAREMLDALVRWEGALSPLRNGPA